jgi:hypothetical protein
MPDPERNTTKVSQSTIDEIRKLGMPKAIQQYHSGNASPEFKTAVERYYSPQRLKTSSPSPSTTAAKKDTGNITSNASAAKSISMPASAPAAATRKISPTVGTPSTLGTATSGARQTADKVLSKVGGGPTTSFGGRNAGTETANAAKSAVGGARSLYRMLTHTQKGAKPKNG